MQKLTISALSIFLIALYACTNKPKGEIGANEKKVASEKTKKDVSELTYYEIYKIALKADNGGGMDFHGDAYGSEAMDQLNLIEGGKCGENDCGTSMLLKNNSDKHINAVIRATYNLPGNPSTEMIRAYKVPSDSAINVGCSHLCWDGKDYPFSREIIQAGFAQTEQ